MTPLTRDEAKRMPSGSKGMIWLTGKEWSDHGLTKSVVKVGNKLYEISDFYNINDMNCIDGYEYAVILEEPDDN